MLLSNPVIRSLRIIAPLALLASAGAAAPTAPVVPPADRAPEIRLSGDRVTIPFVMVREFPFVEGEVAGVKGKLLLDTGDEKAMTLNDHRIPLSGGTPIGTGHFGSGQSFPIRLNAAVQNVRIGPLRFPRATDVQSQDATQLEHITRDFIGWFGYRAWQGYAMKMDYVRSQATFYKGPSADYLAGEKILAMIPFERRKLPNQPVVRIRLADVDATVVFDTGQYGAIFADAATKAHLIAAGVFKQGSKADSLDLTALDIAGLHLPGIPGMDVMPMPFPPAAAIGTDTRTVVTLGYGFLRQYKTVWDFDGKKIYLLGR